jgi:undecaprenyl diphosphate synthase
MDGNRRFADRLGMQRIDGHKQGYAKVRNNTNISTSSSRSQL